MFYLYLTGYIFFAIQKSVFIGEINDKALLTKFSIIWIHLVFACYFKQSLAAACKPLENQPFYNFKNQLEV